MVWARADRPARMLVEVATTDSFKTIRSAVFVDALPESDFTAKLLIEGLPAGQDIFYRVRFQDLRLADHRRRAACRALPHRAGRPALDLVRLVGRHRRPGLGHRRGARRHAHLRDHAAQPPGFLHPLRRQHLCRRPDRRRELQAAERRRSGRTSSPRRSRKPAETLAEFRGNYKYNLLDENLRAFNAEVPIFAQWDDHEVTNNWWPGEPLTRAEHARKKYVDRMPCCSPRAPAAPSTNIMPMRDTLAEPGRIYRKIAYGPLLDVFMLDMRSYRGPNGEHARQLRPDAYFLGPTQIAWLKRELLRFAARPGR